MSDERIARPVSGEIMPGGNSTDTGREKWGVRGPEDVIDADFETVGQERPDAAARRDDRPAPASPPPGGMDILRSGAGPAETDRRGGPAFWLFGLALVAAAFWLSGGHALVGRPAATPPGTAVQPSIGQALRIVDVTSRIERGAQGAFLLVDGEVENAGNRPLPVPPLSISVEAGDGTVERYFLGTSGHVLQPGERFAFSGRLAAPKDGTGTVTLDFRREGES